MREMKVYFQDLKVSHLLILNSDLHFKLLSTLNGKKFYV